jgi:hypothetical protein
MPSLLTWIDHDTAARERVIRILSFMQQKESRDELGLGASRAAFAAAAEVLIESVFLKSAIIG